MITTDQEVQTKVAGILEGIKAAQVEVLEWKGDQVLVRLNNRRYGNRRAILYIAINGGLDDIEVED